MENRGWHSGIGNLVFCFENEKGCNAELVWRKSDEYVILKGSRLITWFQDNSAGAQGRELQKEYAHLIEDDIVLDDIVFPSFEQAANFCSGGFAGYLNLSKTLKKSSR